MNHFHRVMKNLMKVSNHTRDNTKVAVVFLVSGKRFCHERKYFRTQKY